MFSSGSLNHNFHLSVKISVLILTVVCPTLYPHLGSGGSPGESNIQTSPECSGSIVLVLHVEHGAVHVGVALVDSVQLELLEDSPGQEQPGAVSSSVVGETNLDSVPDRAMTVLALGGSEVKRSVEYSHLTTFTTQGGANSHDREMK